LFLFYLRERELKDLERVEEEEEKEEATTLFENRFECLSRRHQRAGMYIPT